MTDKLDVKVGDTVTIVDTYMDRRRDPRSREETIVRVGRAYAYVKEYGREVGYKLDDGWGKGDRAGRMFTPESYAAHERRQQAAVRVGELTRNYSWRDQLSVEQLEAIAAILEQP